MARGKRQKLGTDAVRAHIDGLSHDGRGVARIDGKTVFVEGALPGEDVTFRYVQRRRSHDVGVTEAILTASPHRVEPRCPHYGVCGGCSLQHLDPGAQIQAKGRVLLESFAHLGKVQPDDVLEPLTGPVWGYRRKARLGVKFVEKKGRLLVGFREKRHPFVADLSRCEVLHPSVGGRIAALAELIGGLRACRRIPQVEVAVDDTQAALVFRHLDPLDESDKDRLRAFGEANDLRIFLQPGGPDSIAPLWPEAVTLGYRLEAHDVELRFGPGDFTQVNAEINRAMVARVLALLDVQPGDRVLDLFCGLGNFTLPLARRTAAVVGVEGSAELVARARENARLNGLERVEFHVANLAGELERAPWWEGGFDKVLLDPPRSGARETLEHLAGLRVRRLVYVSCNPSTLARDAGILVHEFGYRLESAGVMDMFPHTAHVESIALFTRP